MQAKQLKLVENQSKNLGGQRFTSYYVGFRAEGDQGIVTRVTTKFSTAVEIAKELVANPGQRALVIVEGIYHGDATTILKWERR